MPSSVSDHLRFDDQVQHINRSGRHTPLASGLETLEAQHVALPIPVDDPLYGQRPPDNDYLEFRTLEWVSKNGDPY